MPCNAHSPPTETLAGGGFMIPCRRCAVCAAGSRERSGFGRAKPFRL